MPTEKSPEDLSLDELRQLMVEKRRKARLGHLERFRRTGRVVNLSADVESEPLERLDSIVKLEDPAYHRLLSRQKLKRVLDRFLLLIELLAVFGLVFVIYSGINIIRDLNSEFAHSLTPATPTPTALYVPVILPSGHTPPDSSGSSQPNEKEIPAHLLSIYLSKAPLPVPTSGPEQATQIQIPAIGVDAPIVQGDGWEQLKQGVAQYIGSANPGESGNMVLSAHNDVYGEIFRDLDQLEEGEEIIVNTANHSFTYIISNIQIVEPTDVDVMEPTPDPTVTLISCYPYWVDTHRIVVRASLKAGIN